MQRSCRIPSRAAAVAVHQGSNKAVPPMSLRKLGGRRGALAASAWRRPLAGAGLPAAWQPTAGGVPRRFCSAASGQAREGNGGDVEAHESERKEREEDNKRSGSDGERRQRSAWRHMFWVFPVTTFFLGSWQVQRRAWKEGLIESMASRCAAEPTPWAELPKELREDFDEGVVQEWAYRPVSAAGCFDHSKEFHLGPRVVDGKSGFHIVTPFHLDSGYDSSLTALLSMAIAG